MCVRIYIENDVYQWSLQTRSECRASRIAGPIGVVRAASTPGRHKADRLQTRLTPALEIALADCAKACRRLSEVIQKPVVQQTL